MNIGIIGAGQTGIGDAWRLKEHKFLKTDIHLFKGNAIYAK